MSREMLVNKEFFEFSKAFKENFVTLIISALGLVVALSWNNFWVAWITSLSIENATPYKFITAMFITAFAVVLTYILSKIKGNH